MIGSKRIKLSEGMAIHIQNELVLALKELEKAYESKKDSLTEMANSSWVKALKEYVASKNKEDGVDAKLPDIDELIKKLASDEYIEKKIKDVLGDDMADEKTKNTNK